jgi:tripartite ATP-independent transporter DctP family solute receptor
MQTSKRRAMAMSAVTAAVLLLGACGGASGSGDAAAGGDGEYTATMRLATVIEPDHPYNEGAREFADRIAEATDGRIKIEVFDSGQLGAGERELLEGLQQGTIDLTVVSSGPVSGFSEPILAFDLPFLFRDNDHVDAVMDGEIGRQVLDDFEQADIKGLALWENGFRHLSNDVRPVVDPEDAKGLRLRTMENPVHLDTWKAWGTDPTPMSFGELYTALQQGVVDGQENPVPVFTAAGFAEVQEHLSLTGHFYSPAPIAMSLKVFNEMPEEDQQLFLDAAVEVAAFERDLVRTQSEEQLPALEDAGVQIVPADEIDQQKWQDAASEVYDTWADRVGQDVIDAILETES